MHTEILFWTDSVIAFDADSWRTEPCPGSELAVIHTARALAARPELAVHVVCRARRPGRHDGVHYHALDRADAALARADVVVHVRDYWGRAPACGHDRSRHILWFQDTAREIASLAPGATMDDLRARLLGFDGLVFVSAWHRAEVLGAVGLPERGANAPTPPAVVFHQPLPALPAPGPRRPATLIHTAHPRKAIGEVLRAWPHIARERDDVELVLCGHPQIYQEDAVPVGDGRATLADIVATFVPTADPRIRILPRSLPQQALLVEVAAATLLLHPDTSVETGATTVLEAMAVGTVPAVSDAGCLPELCQDRGAITPLGRDFAARYAADVLALLADTEARVTLARRGREDWAHLSDLDHLAERWLRLIARCRRAAPRPPGARERAATRARAAANAPARATASTTARREPRRWQVVDADDLPASQWADLCASSPEAWFTHTRAWYLAAERDVPAVRPRWFGVLDDGGALAALVPLAAPAAHPRLLVSGLREPAGPCLRREFSEPARRELAEVVLQALEDRAARAGADHIAIKFAATCRAGLRVPRPDIDPAAAAGPAPAVLPALRLGGYGVRAAPLAVIAGADRWSRVSERVRTQIRRARERCRVAAVTERAHFATLCELYQAHTDAKAVIACSPAQLELLWRAPGLDTRLFLARIADRAVGFAIGVRLGLGAALFAWGLTCDDALAAGAAKSLVYDAADDLLVRGAEAVECGGRFTTAPAGAPGIDEFYRRLGARLHPGVYAARRLPPSPEVAYVVR